MNVPAMPMSQTHWRAVEVVVLVLQANRLWGGAGQGFLEDTRNARLTAYLQRQLHTDGLSVTMYAASGLEWSE